MTTRSADFVIDQRGLNISYWILRLGALAPLKGLCFREKAPGGLYVVQLTGKGQTISIG